MTQMERMRAQLAYRSFNPEILQLQLRYIAVVDEYNATRPTEQRRRTALLRRMFGAIGKDCYFEPPIHANFGCRHVFCGNGVQGNFNLTFVDDGEIHIGDRTMFGPNVTLVTAGHPIEPALRRYSYQFNRPVHIGANVWLGTGVIVLPGVTIGDNSVIGAGSVVTRDIPANVVAMGVPCRVRRKIGARDRQRLYDGRSIDWEQLQADEIALTGHPILLTSPPHPPKSPARDAFIYPSPVGPLLVEIENGKLVCLKKNESLKKATPFATVKGLSNKVFRELTEYFAGKRKLFDLPLSMKGTAFQQKVWRALLQISYGETRTYGEMAAAIGSPKATRAVGMACHVNPLCIVVPCHRVIGSNGRLTGYAEGLAMKQKLLDLEKSVKHPRTK